MIDTPIPERYGAPWTREELILAFELYCRIPFSKAVATNPVIIELAGLLRRSTASVARKLGNFGSFDPKLQQRQISGLVHASKLDGTIWEEFSHDWNRLVLEAQRLRDAMTPASEAMQGEDHIQLPQGVSEKERPRKDRMHQAFFREAVLSSYNESCCITGLRIPECLTASHIIPWSVAEHHRADPRNGLCLSATFDRLFDRGLITVTDTYQVIVSTVLHKTGDKRIDEMIVKYHGAPIIRPKRFLPLSDHLEWHRENIFRG